MPRFPRSALLVALLTGAAPAARPGPRWTADGALIRPDSVDRWVTVGTSLGLGYNDPTSAGPGQFQPLFHRVSLEPRAYEVTRRSGRFPPGTMLALVLAPAAARVSPARQGVFADRATRLEVAVKDPARFPGGWGYFDFGAAEAGATARAIPAERCARCHAEHGARDNVFVQFYPVLRDDDGGALPTSPANGMLSAPVGPLTPP
ncbi:MAG TPA: cytochrome P460 family protein [Gemmatimonadales bacterium]|nr:cytochrome P460 family protein [Gemmatimonadales bacterium]